MKQNIIICLLSVVATLLAVVVVQNFTQQNVLVGQSGGSTATVGPIGVATGKFQGGGDSQAFWLYLPGEDRLMVYNLGSRNRLELRAVRNVEYDKQLFDHSFSGKYPKVKDVQVEVKKQMSRTKK